MAKDHADEDIEELRQVQLNSLRRLAERLQNELDEVRSDNDGLVMSPWLELLLNVIALAGFVVVATYYRPSKKHDGQSH